MRPSTIDRALSALGVHGDRYAAARHSKDIPKAARERPEPHRSPPLVDAMETLGHPPRPRKRGRR